MKNQTTCDSCGVRIAKPANEKIQLSKQCDDHGERLIFEITWKTSRPMDMCQRCVVVYLRALVGDPKELSIA